jgi:hypothetical protein
MSMKYRARQALFRRIAGIEEHRMQRRATE